MNAQIRLLAHKAKFEGRYFTAVELLKQLINLESNPSDIDMLQQIQNKLIVNPQQVISAPF